MLRRLFAHLHHGAPQAHGRHKAPSDTWRPFYTIPFDIEE